MKDRPNAILFRAHAVTPGTQRALEKLVREAGPSFDVWVVGYCQQPGALDRFGHPNTVSYDRAALSELPYRVKLAGVEWTRTIGHNDLPTMRFFHDHPEYDRYWIVEYDVRFTGHWRALLTELSLSRADLLGTTVQSFDDNPAWASWPSLVTGPDRVPPKRWLKAFLPFCAVSRRGMAAIDRAYRRGWSGHYEAAWATSVALARLVVEDIGNTGRFVPRHRRGRYYVNSPLDPYLSPGSFVYRPEVAREEFFDGWNAAGHPSQAWAAANLTRPDMLVHPVKG